MVYRLSWLALLCTGGRDECGCHNLQRQNEDRLIGQADWSADLRDQPLANVAPSKSYSALLQTGAHLRDRENNLCVACKDGEFRANCLGPSGPDFNQEKRKFARELEIAGGLRLRSGGSGSRRIV